MEFVAERVTHVQLPEGYYVALINPESLIKNHVVKEVGALRHRVWAARGMDMSNSLVANSWVEKEDYHAYIWGVYFENKLIASARLSMHTSIETLPESSLYTQFFDQISYPIASFNRLVVCENHRGLQLSTFLVTERINMSLKLGASCIVFDCPGSRVSKMKAHGFSPLGQPQAGSKCSAINWVVMHKKLATKHNG
ncbi:hypothetical protein [Pseudoalteromonas tunicata]|uniref:hypothetical protein n=1 Tax=Pseudoalteromonas tunicata TaxID=314281 RepID=UPI00273D4089|nr:hypothetical protein [Pseudoalteromonas tunicata]MDP4983254.1 hypothetical protein [Pseudoalteromonas tunicata]MDP5214495.1 hypothetical protein [Pseudoalteromonas tunicata]